METPAAPTPDQVDDFYIAKINMLIATGRDSLIATIVEDHDRLRGAAARRAATRPAA